MTKNQQKKKKQTLLDNIFVTADNVLVEPLSSEYETSEGLVRPEQYEDKAYKGIVIAVGDDVIGIKKGMTAYFNRYSTVEIQFDEVKLLALKYEDILAYEK